MIIALASQLLLTTTYLLYSVLNVKARAGAFNQEKALVGAFSVIVKTDCETDGSFYSTGNRFVLRWRRGGVACKPREREQKLCINNWANVLEGVVIGAL